MTCQWQLLPASWRLNPHSTFLQQNDYWKKLRAARLIECDFHEHFVSKAGSVISSKSPSPAFRWSMYYTELEIDRYIVLPIFFPIFKHFTIIGYRFWKKTITDIFFLFFISHIHNYTEYNQQWNVFSAFDPSRYTHTWSSPHTHTWSSGHCSLRRSSSTTTACNFIQDSLVWNMLNYINIYYRTIISPINISIEVNYLLSQQAIAVWV